MADNITNEKSEQDNALSKTIKVLTDVDESIMENTLSDTIENNIEIKKAEQENISSNTIDCFTEIQRFKEDHIVDGTSKDSTQMGKLFQQVPLNHLAVINTSNSNSPIPHNTNNILNLNKIILAKTNVLSNVKLCPISSNQIQQIPSLAIVNNTPFVRLQPKPSNTSNTNNNNNSPKPNQDLSSGVVVVPCTGMKYVLKKIPIIESKTDLLKIPNTSVVKPLNTENESVEKKQKLILPKKIPNFIARVQKLPNGNYKMVPGQGEIPVGFENFFNKTFIKHKIPVNPSPNKQDINPSINAKNTTLKSFQFTTKEIKFIQPNKLSSLGKSSCDNISTDYVTMKKNIKLIPHTITSKDCIENQQDFTIETQTNKANTSNEDVSTNTIQQEICAETIKQEICSETIKQEICTETIKQEKCAETIKQEISTSSKLTPLSIKPLNVNKYGLYK